MIAYCLQQAVVAAIAEGARFARRRLGRYEVIDCVAVLLGYGISGERTLEEFYQRLQPFAAPFMALFGRERLPGRSTLSRFLAALTPELVEAHPITRKMAATVCSPGARILRSRVPWPIPTLVR